MSTPNQGPKVVVAGTAPTDSDLVKALRREAAQDQETIARLRAQIAAADALAEAVEAEVPIGALGTWVEAYRRLP